MPELEQELAGSFLFVCAVYDLQVKAFAPPVFYKTLGQAERDFKDAAQNPETNIAKHPEDYTFHCLGRFFEEKGVFTNTAVAPQLICTALSVAVPASGVDSRMRIPTKPVGA